MSLFISLLLRCSSTYLATHAQKQNGQEGQKQRQKGERNKKKIGVEGTNLPHATPLLCSSAPPPLLLRSSSAPPPRTLQRTHISKVGRREINKDIEKKEKIERK
jgi:hypothetical protein